MSLSHNTRRVLPFVRTHSAPTKGLAHSMTSINIYEKKKREREGGRIGGNGEITISQNLRAQVRPQQSFTVFYHTCNIHGHTLKHTGPPAGEVRALTARCGFMAASPTCPAGTQGPSPAAAPSPLKAVLQEAPSLTPLLGDVHPVVSQKSHVLTVSNSALPVEGAFQHP